jgi:hypothetical protein
MKPDRSWTAMPSTYDRSVELAGQVVHCLNYLRLPVSVRLACCLTTCLASCLLTRGTQDGKCVLASSPRSDTLSSLF